MIWMTFSRAAAVMVGVPILLEASTGERWIEASLEAVRVVKAEEVTVETESPQLREAVQDLRTAGRVRRVKVAEQAAGANTAAIITELARSAKMIAFPKLRAAALDGNQNHRKVEAADDRRDRKEEGDREEALRERDLSFSSTRARMSPTRPRAASRGSIASCGLRTAWESTRTT